MDDIQHKHITTNDHSLRGLQTLIFLIPSTRKTPGIKRDQRVYICKIYLGNDLIRDRGEELRLDNLGAHKVGLPGLSRLQTRNFLDVIKKKTTTQIHVKK